MDWQRSILIGAMALVVWLLVIQWNQFQEAKQLPAETVESTQATLADTPILPTVSDTLDQELPQLGSVQPQPVVETKAPDSRLVTVRTNVQEVLIDTLGGDIVQVQLLEHLENKARQDEVPFTLLTSSAENTYVAQSGLVGANGTDTSEGRPQFSVTADQYIMTGGDNELVVDLRYREGAVNLVKRFVFKRDTYAISVSYIVDNGSDSAWNATFYGQIKRDSHQPLVTSTGVKPYLGAALRTPDKNYFKYDFDDMQDGSFTTAITGGWVSMVQHYFISAWVPPQDQKNNFSLRKLPGRDIYLMGFTGQALQIPAGQQGEYTAIFYAGPKNQAKLEALAQFLDLTVDYGFLWMIAKPIFYGLELIHGWIGNWGWSIILLTVLIKFLLYPLSAASLRSMAKMRRLQPEMARLKELYGDDRQKMSQELMNIYKKEKVNPAGGCIPVLLQMPVFLALYWVLLESVEIRHAPWVLWISDLSAKDPYFILPLIMGASMWFMQKLQPTPPDPTQAKIMQIMPIAFTFFFMLFPAGLVLYWTVNNLLSILQQWYVTRQLEGAHGKT